MSYMIRYGQDIRQETRMKKSALKRNLALAAVFAVVLAGILWPQGRELAAHLLFPWFNESTSAAFSKMIGQIGSGTAVPAAVLDFCRDLFSNAGIPV